MLSCPLLAFKPILLRMARALQKSIVVAFAAMVLNLPAAAEGPPSAWPGKVVTMEELSPLTAFRLKVPGSIVKGAVRGPAILRVHLDINGTVTQAVLLNSCGNTDLDEAALHAMRVMKFRPYPSEGPPTEVSLVVPVHVPMQLGRSW